MPPQNPPTGDSEAVLQGNPVSNIPSDRAEGVLSLLKFTPYGQQSSMGDLIASHHQTRLANAQMYSNAAKTALHAQLAIQHGIDPDSGLRFDDPNYKGPSADDQAARYKANYEEAWTNYKKIAGVDQNTKGAIAKAESILNHILGGGAMQSAPGAPSNQGRPGGMAPPPQAQATPPAGGAAPQTVTSVGITEPPKAQGLDDVSSNPLAAPMIEANTQFQERTDRGLQANQRLYEQQHALWRREADQLFPKDSKEWKWYSATGTLPRQFGLQAKDIEFRDETGIHRVKANYDPTTGQFEYQGKIIDNAQIADKPQLIKYVKTDQSGRPHLIGGFMLGTQLYDQQMNPLPPNTEFYSRGLFGTDTLHQQITIGPDGSPMINTLERVTTPTYQKAIWGDEQPPPAASGNEQPISHGPAAVTTPTRQGGATPPPAAPAKQSQARPSMHGSQNVDARGRPLGLPSGQFTVQSKGATGVDQARNSLVGDDIEKGQVGGLAKDMDVFKSPESMKRIGEYLQLVHNQAANEGDSFAHAGDTIGAVKWFVGLPQLNITLQQGALRDQYNQLTDDEKKFVADYFRVMGTMGGMRASTGMPGYQWAFTNMYNEMPTPGKVNNYDDAVRRLMNYVKETNVVSKRNSLIKKIDTEDAEKQVRSSGRSGGMTQPPTSSGGTVRFSDNGTNYNIPSSMVSEFQKDHPNAKRQ